jgi:outer membrane receptor protein involved in Fe transport
VGVSPGRFQGPGPGFCRRILNGTVDSNLQDAAIFLEHRLQFSPQWSVLYGLRGDLVQLNYSDPLGGPTTARPGPVDPPCPRVRPPSWYGLYNGNISVVYSPTPHVSTYLTYNKAQYVLPEANDGAVATWGVRSDHAAAANTLLEEAGVKFDLFDKALFISSAVSTRSARNPPARVSRHRWLTSPAPRSSSTTSRIRIFRHRQLLLPAHHGWIRRRHFYNFPAQPGFNIRWRRHGAVFQPNQTFQDPGVPQHLFNVLANYKTSPAGALRRTFRSRDPSKPPNPVTELAATEALAAGFLPRSGCPARLAHEPMATTSRR